jgi:phosphoglycerol transferase MdoB-like AlkP superfamily enzyme
MVNKLKHFFFPAYIQVLLLRMGIVLLGMFFSRIIFYLANYGSFPRVEFIDFLTGTWFDCITVCIYFIPFYSFFLLPFPIRRKLFHRRLSKLFFHAINSLILFFNLIDVEYFQYTSKRSTFDLFSMVGSESDLLNLLFSFVKDFWILIFLFIILIFLSEGLYRKTDRIVVGLKEQSSSFYKNNTILFLVYLPLFLLIGRGGWGIRPVGVMEASNYTRKKVENTAFIMNTAFTMVKSYGKKPLEIKKYFSLREEEKIFSPVHTSHPQHLLPDGTNVMIIILESFGNEFVGAYNKAESFTPFLDSLIGESLHFEFGFSNGKKSIEAVPAIVASIPSLMDNPYISSPYGNNKIRTLAHILGERGYETAFFHGATNGSMKFDAFAVQAGYQKYFGRTEYHNNKHHDGTWGILDEYFNPWTAKEMSKLKQPFFSTLFTLSSHHPYFVPEHLRSKVKKGSQPICASINYGDYSLRKFFEEAKKQSWYDNTLFVICADHTPATNSVMYSQRTHMYKIPILFYHPKKLIQPKREKKIFQHLDIFPTVIDLLNINMKYYSYGQSFYSPADREAITYIDGSYFYFINQHMYSFSNDKARNLYDFAVREKYTQDSLSFYKQEAREVENRLRAMIQRYNRDLILNQTTVE